MSTTRLGMAIISRAHGPSGRRRTGGRYGPAAIDILCRVKESGGVVGAAAGSDWVDLDPAYITPGEIPPIRKVPAGATGTFVLGVVEASQGTKALGTECWVRIYGIHEYAKIQATGAHAPGSWLNNTSGGSAGEAGAGVSPYLSWGGTLLLAATAGAGLVAKRVFVRNSYGIELL